MLISGDTAERNGMRLDHYYHYPSTSPPMAQARQWVPQGRLGFRATAESLAIGAVEMFERHAYDAVLMDCRMPVMDGLEATREIRQRWGETRPVPIIAVTAHAMPADRRRCLEAGMNDHVAKPLKIASLVTVLGRWVALPGRPDDMGLPSVDASPR